jgi:hypothetical protein
MIGLAPGTKVFLACQPTDLRAGFDGLAARVQQTIGADPFICVERKYVAVLYRIAERRETASFAATYDSIQMLSSNRSTGSLGRNRACCLLAMPAMSSPRRIISTSAAA